MNCALSTDFCPASAQLPQNTQLALAANGGVLTLGHGQLTSSAAVTIRQVNEVEKAAGQTKSIY